MIFALGTPIDARTKPWEYDWSVKPDALMISAIDLLPNKRLFKKIVDIGIHDFLGWDGRIVCDSGAFSAINRRKEIKFDLETLKEIYREFNRQDSDILKISLDYPDGDILSNYEELMHYEVQPVVPFDREDLIDPILNDYNNPDWIFVGRLVPLMKRGGQFKERLFKALLDFKEHISTFTGIGSIKIWALGVGAPSIINDVGGVLDGCDSSRWRITSANMILLPYGGERGVGRITKWRGTSKRISENGENKLVLKILRNIDELSGGLENLDSSLGFTKSPKMLESQKELNLPTIGDILTKIRDNDDNISVYHLELILRSSSRLRLFFNYFSALNYKVENSLKNNY